MLGSSPFQAFRTEADDGGHRLNLHSCMCRVKDYTNSIIVSLTDPALNSVRCYSKLWNSCCFTFYIIV